MQHTRAANWCIVGGQATILLLCVAIASPAVSEPRNGIALRGEPTLPSDYSHLPYVNPRAPDGGALTLCDVLPGELTLKQLLSPRRYYLDSTYPQWLQSFIGTLVFDSLLVPNLAEPFSFYGLIARSVEASPKKDSLTFFIDPDARFEDGASITVEDVLASITLTRNIDDRLGRIETVERLGEDGLRITFNPVYFQQVLEAVGLLPILPDQLRHRDLREPIEVPLAGSGHYRVTVSTEREISLERLPGYWATKHPARRGLDNFKGFEVHNFGNFQVVREAFKAGHCSIFVDRPPYPRSPTFDFPAAKDGRVQIDLIEPSTPRPIAAYLINTDRPPLSNLEFRAQISEIFDFKDFAKDFDYELPLMKADGFFDGSRLSSNKVLRWLDLSRTERNAKFLSATGDRVDLTVAARNAGYERQGEDRDGIMVSVETGDPLRLEILAPKFSRMPVPDISATLESAGVDVEIAALGWNEYTRRVQSRDYDIAFIELPAWRMTPDPIFLYYHWSTVGFGGSQEIDGLIDNILYDGLNLREFYTAVEELDWLLFSGRFAAPLYYYPHQLVAYWNQLSRPDVTPMYGFNLRSWWSKGTIAMSAAGEFDTSSGAEDEAKKVYKEFTLDNRCERDDRTINIVISAYGDELFDRKSVRVGALVGFGASDVERKFPRNDVILAIMSTEDVEPALRRKSLDAFVIECDDIRKMYGSNENFMEKFSSYNIWRLELR